MITIGTWFFAALNCLYFLAEKTTEQRIFLVGIRIRFIYRASHFNYLISRSIDVVRITKLPVTSHPEIDCFTFFSTTMCCSLSLSSSPVLSTHSSRPINSRPSRAPPPPVYANMAPTVTRPRLSYRRRDMHPELGRVAASACILALSALVIHTACLRSSTIYFFEVSELCITLKK